MKEKFIPARITIVGVEPGKLISQIRSMKEEDIDWKKGRAWSLVYWIDEAHEKLLDDAARELGSANYLNPLAFKSLHKMEQEVVHMTASMLHGDEHTVGVMSSGGTESILLAMFCYRQLAKKLHPRISRPEVVVPSTAHPAFDKAAILFDLVLRKVPVDESGKADVKSMEKFINGNTILLVGSAPGYPNGILDPIDSISRLAAKYKLPLHVDACIGGFMLPWVEKCGYTIDAWDFRVNGVTSISADVHKFGFGAKGASVLLYRSMDYMQHQFIVTTDFPGGIYISPTLLGTRAGGPIAAAWASLNSLGENGFMQLAKTLMDGAVQLKNRLQSMKGIQLIGHPCMNILSYSTINNDPDIYVIADKMEDMGWMVDRQQHPDCIHLTVLPTNVGVIDTYINDLQEALDYARKHPEATSRGNAAIYGLMARVPFRKMVERSVKKIMQEMFGAQEEQEKRAIQPDHGVKKGSKFMGAVNRLLFAMAKRKRIRMSKRRKAKAGVYS